MDEFDYKVLPATILDCILTNWSPMDSENQRTIEEWGYSDEFGFISNTFRVHGSTAQVTMDTPDGPKTFEISVKEVK